VAFGRLAVVIDKVAAVTAMESAFWAVAGVPCESCTLAVKLDVTTAVGVPLMTPVEGASDNPAGREPERIDHV
jgi:hypothetical protein